MIPRVCAAIMVAAGVVSGVARAQPAPGPDAAPVAPPPAPAPEPAAAPAEHATPPPGGTSLDPRAPLPEPAAPAPAEPRFVWQLFGYLRAQYIAVQDDPNVAFVGRDDGFELQNARLGIRGALDHRVAFEVAFDGAVDERLQVNTPQGKLRVGLRDAFADVAIAGSLAVRGGFFQALADPEAMVGDTARELVDHPIESRGMRATEGYQTSGLTPGRSLGAAVRLEPARDGGGLRVGFELAVQNGADEFSSNNDNDQPAISAAVFARVARDGWVMAAGRFNPRTTGDLPFRQDENDLQGIAGLRLAVGPVVLGGGAIVQRTSFPTTGGPIENAFGGHAQVMLNVPAGLPLAVGYRFGILDPSSLISTDRVMEHTVGAVLALPRYRMRVQLQLTHVVEQAARELDNDRAQLAAELAL